jgi:hypothetical protein
MLECNNCTVTAVKISKKRIMECDKGSYKMHNGYRNVGLKDMVAIAKIVNLVDIY